MPRVHPLVLSVLLIAGCAGYEPRPLVDQDVLHDLARIRLEALAPLGSSSLERAPGADEQTVNVSDGLSEGEAVAIALTNNPDLRAFREQRGVQQGELVQAGLYPNAQLQVRALTIPRFDTAAVDLTGVWYPPRFGQIEKQETRARAGIESVRADIRAREWQLAADVRKAFVGLVAAEQQLRIAKAGVELRQRIERFIRERREHGDASLVDVNQILIERVSSEREALAAENERNAARLELKRLMGVPPELDLALDGRDALAFHDHALELEPLLEVMLHHRPDLLAAKEQYKGAEASLDLAYLARNPWLYFGPSYEREGSAEVGLNNRFGMQVGLINIPVGNRNQGQIAIAEAQRTRLGERFRALVHQGRAEVADALRNVRGQRRIVRQFEETIRPALEENARLTEAGFEMHEFNLVQLIATQELVLRNQREFVRAELEYRRAVLDLERALGAPLEALR